MRQLWIRWGLILALGCGDKDTTEGRDSGGSKDSAGGPSDSGASGVESERKPKPTGDKPRAGG